jgi:hypothetical protein
MPPRSTTRPCQGQNPGLSGQAERRAGRLSACGRQPLPGGALTFLAAGPGPNEEVPDRYRLGGILLGRRSAAGWAIGAQVMNARILATSTLGCIVNVVVRSADVSLGS